LSVCQAGGWRAGKIAACHSIACVGAPDAESWQPALAALAQWLGGKDRKKSIVHIALSGRFVRWQLLPWRAELTQSSELASYAKLRFREIFGHAADGWQVLRSPQPPGQTVPACAIDAALLQALGSACEGAGARLATVTPYFASAFDRWRKTLGGQPAWFGLIESDCLTLGLVQGGNWLGLRTQRLDEDWRELLPSLMVQMGIVANLADAKTPLYLVGEGSPPAPVAGLAFTWLQPKVAAQHTLSDYRRALGV
jgi:hypothetical protein